jgi:hypothetical protein
MVFRAIAFTVAVFAGFYGYHKAQEAWLSAMQHRMEDVRKTNSFAVGTPVTVDFSKMQAAFNRSPNMIGGAEWRPPLPSQLVNPAAAATTAAAPMSVQPHWLPPTPPPVERHAPSLPPPFVGQSLAFPHR